MLIRLDKVSGAEHIESIVVPENGVKNGSIVAIGEYAGFDNVNVTKPANITTEDLVMIVEEFVDKVGNQEETNMLWKAYNRVTEANPTIMNTYASTQVQAMIYQEVTQKEGKKYVYDVDDLVSHAMKYAMELKERSDDGKSTTPLGLVSSGKDVSTGQNKRNSKKNR